MTRAENAYNAAAAWIIRREDGEWSEKDAAEFKAWLTESDGNRAAYWRLNHSWAEADRIGAVGVQPVDARHRPRWRPYAIAASVALLFGIGSLAYWKDRSIEVAATTHYETVVGGHKRVSLADGSQVELNTKTRLRAAMGVAAREVWLDDGEAFFEIAKRKGRPFVVHAGPKTVTVLGTKFSVRRDGDRIYVAVKEGRVRIDDVAAAKSPRSTVIAAGDVAVTTGVSILVSAADPERVEARLAWRDGMLGFDQTPLSDVAAEFNRYNEKKLVVADDGTGSLRIGGSFNATNVDAFARLLRDAYGLRIEDRGSEVLIAE